MGTEIVCEAKYKRASYRVKVHLDAQTLTLRDELKLSIPLKEIQQVAAKGDLLTVKWKDSTVVLDVGNKAERLADSIRNPRSLLDRLGIKPDHTVSILGLDDPSFVQELRQRTNAVADDSVKAMSDVIFLRARERADPLNYYPAAALPGDSVFVVRTSALKELEAVVSQREQPPEKPIERRERTSLFVIIAALAKMAKIDVKKPSAAAIAIETQTELMGTRVAARTIENHLNRIPEALESREGK